MTEFSNSTGTSQSESSNGAKRASIGELVGQVSDQFARLMRAEVDSYKTELKQKATRSGAGAGMLGAAGLLALFALAAFIGAAIAGFANIVPVWAAFLIVGGILLVVVAALALLGKNELKNNKPPMPQQAVSRIKEDLSSVKKELK